MKFSKGRRILVIFFLFSGVVTSHPDFFVSIFPKESVSAMTGPTRKQLGTENIQVTASPTFVPTSPIPTGLPPRKLPVFFPSANMGLLKQVNDFRKIKGLSAVTSTPLLCRFAATRAYEISKQFSHEGFQQRISQHTLPFTSYTLLVENLAWNTNTEQVVSSWIHSPAHAANFLAQTPFGCIGIFGIYAAYEGWKP